VLSYGAQIPLIGHGPCVCVIDPEGDDSALEGLPGVTVLNRKTAEKILDVMRIKNRVWWRPDV
jgi:hypothetical protein